VSASLANSQTVTVLIFVPLTVDSLAAASVLYELFRRDNILNHFVPVRGYADLHEHVTSGLADETLPRSVVFINCGASISLLRRYPNAFEASTAYVIDSHRPVHLENLDSRVESVKVFDDSQGLADFLFVLPDSQADDEHSIIVSATQKTDGVARLVHKKLDPANREVAEFLGAAQFSDPAAVQMYALASTLNHTSLSILWFAILGLTEHFLLEHIDSDRYEVVFNALHSEASRMTAGVKLFTTVATEDGDVVSPNNTITVPLAPNFHIQPCLDVRFCLMRHWTLLESMSCSPYVASRLRLWTHEGSERLSIFLAKMGIPLRDAQAAYIAMSSDLRDSLVRRFDAQCDAQGLSGGHFASFLLKRGFAAHLAAADVVHAVRARLARAGDYAAHFAAAFAVVRMAGNQDILSDGVEAAKARLKCVVGLGIELMSRRGAWIVNAGAFRIAYIHNAAERGFPVEADALVDLAQFIAQAFRACEEPVLPIVVAALDAGTQMWLVVAVATAFEFGEVEASRFGVYFREAAQRAEIEIGTDAFDSFVCQVPNELLLAFVDQLTLVASQSERQ
jgi:cell division control protein 45